jgi:CheY-like chemotaxis protein
MRVLYIEDTAVNSHAMGRIVKHLGHEMIVAENGQQGLLLLDEHPDLILLDINLPDIDGFAALKQIKSANPNVPIIAVTAHVMTGERERCIQAGFTDYVAKPFRFEAMSNLLQTYASSVP